MSKSIAILQDQLSTLLEQKRDKIKKIVPEDVDVDRIIGMAGVAVLENPKLASCTPFSVFRSVVQAASLGLKVGKSSNEAYLVPYKSECTMQASYIGWMKLARGEYVHNIQAAVVYDNDEFEYHEAPKHVVHKPVLKGDRGELTGAYAVAYSKDGSIYDATWVRVEELAAIQEKALKMRSDPWRDHPDRMRRKTAIRRLAKGLPLNEKGARLAQIEEMADSGNNFDPDIDTIEEMAASQAGSTATAAEKKKLRARAETKEIEASDIVYMEDESTSN